MANEYRHKAERRGHHRFTAFGKPYWDKGDVFDAPSDRRPTIDLSVEHIPGEFVVPYDNRGTYNPHDPAGITGLSRSYTSHLLKNLENKPEELLTGYDEDAMYVFDHIGSGGREGEKAREIYEHSTQEGGWDNPHFLPDKLFEKTPSIMRVNAMYADPRMRASVLSLGAVAKTHLNADIVESSEDLSAHSSRLTRSAMSRGLPIITHTGNPYAEQTNTIDFNEDQSFPVHKITEERFGKIIPEETVSKARTELRSMLRPQKQVRNSNPVTPKGLSQQFLPGMEGFV